LERSLAYQTNNDQQTWRGAGGTTMPHPVRYLAFLVIAAAVAIAVGAASGRAAESRLARGKYLVSIMGCTDCHTPGSLEGKPDMARFLGGGDVGWYLPGLGTFVAANITPDKATGIGDWTEQQIVTALTTGKRPDGRVLAPIMPGLEFAHLTKTDAFAIAAYLQSLPPVKNQVPGPFGPNEKVPILIETIVPGSGMPHK
jgi:mono/diheme cytochrome c family protein